MKVLFPSSSKLVEELNTENVMGGQIKVNRILASCLLLPEPSEIGRTWIIFSFQLNILARIPSHFAVRPKGGENQARMQSSMIRFLKYEISVWMLLGFGVSSKGTILSSSGPFVSFFTFKAAEKKKLAFTSLSSSIYKDVRIKCSTNDKNNPSRQDKHCRIIKWSC